MINKKNGKKKNISWACESFAKKSFIRQVVVAHTLNASTWRAGTGRCLRCLQSKFQDSHGYTKNTCLNFFTRSKLIIIYEEILIEADMAFSLKIASSHPQSEEHIQRFPPSLAQATDSLSSQLWAADMVCQSRPRNHSAVSVTACLHYGLAPYIPTKHFLVPPLFTLKTISPCGMCLLPWPLGYSMLSVQLTPQCVSLLIMLVSSCLSWLAIYAYSLYGRLLTKEPGKRSQGRTGLLRQNCLELTTPVTWL